MKANPIEAGQALFGYLQGQFSQRTQRERIMIVTAAALALVFLGLVAGSSLGRASRARAATIAAKEQALGQVADLSRRYLALERELSGLRLELDSDAQISLFAELEGLASDTLSREKIGGINPSVRRLTDDLDEEVVEITLNGVTLRGLVELLYRIEKEDRRLGVTRLRIKKRFNDPHLFDCQLSVSRIRAAAGGRA